MFSTADYYLASEVAYRRERTTGDWKAVKAPSRRGERLRGRLRVPRRPHLRLSGNRRRAAVVA